MFEDSEKDISSSRREVMPFASISDEGIVRPVDGKQMFGLCVEHGDSAMEKAAYSAGRFDEDEAVNEAAERLKTRYLYRFFKRLFDIAFSLFVLIAFSWLFLIVAIAIKVDDPAGPVLFKQKRVAKDGREFQMYKFRSMCVDAESRLDELRSLNEKTGPVFKMSDDPRVTRVGHWLRKLSLASVIIGTPGDGESTKSLPRSANSSLDLQLCERRPGLCCIARPIITYLIFLSSAFFGGQVGVLKRSLRAVDVVSDGRVCAVAQTACAAVPLAEDWTVAA